MWRRAHGLTQEEAASHFGVHRKKYWKIEAGRLTANPLPPILNWAKGDLCALARLRHGKRFRETASMIGISHVTLSAWEKTGDKRLIKFWKSMGYRFGWERAPVQPPQEAN
jgi:hypothetical protein